MAAPARTPVVYNPSHNTRWKKDVIDNPLFDPCMRTEPPPAKQRSPGGVGTLVPGRPGNLGLPHAKVPDPCPTPAPRPRAPAATPPCLARPEPAVTTKPTPAVAAVSTPAVGIPVVKQPSKFERVIARAKSTMLVGGLVAMSGVAVCAMGIPLGAILIVGGIVVIAGALVHAFFADSA